MIALAKRNNTRLIMAVAIIALILFCLLQVKHIVFNITRECEEWGVVKIDTLTGNESWAPINRVPKDEEDAANMANELEANELTARYDYKARCKRYKK